MKSYAVWLIYSQNYTPMATKTFYSIQYVLFCKSWQQLLSVIIGTGRENKSERTIIIITVLHAEGPQVYTYM